MADLKTMREYSTVEEPAFSEIVIKKSRFIGQIYPAKSFEEAGELILASKKKYWDAGHGCTAMIFGLDRSLMRCSDAGEPQGTAGVPMLEVLKGSGLTNLLMISTRYFGGTLLGTGGLVRAYTQSVQETLKNAEIITYRPVEVYRLVIPFRMLGKVDAYLKGEGIFIDDLDYADNVSMTLRMRAEQEDKFLKMIAEVSAGKITPEKREPEFIRLAGK